MGIQVQIKFNQRMDELETVIRDADDGLSRSKVVARALRSWAQAPVVAVDELQGYLAQYRNLLFPVYDHEQGEVKSVYMADDAVADIDTIGQYLEKLDYSISGLKAKTGYNRTMIVVLAMERYATKEAAHAAETPTS